MSVIATTNKKKTVYRAEINLTCVICCRSVLPVWEELLIFNENYKYFIQEKPKVIILFEVCTCVTFLMFR